MKKWFLIIFLIILLPINILAKDGISDYYIDMTVLENGDVLVEELFVLEGSFNGYERILNYRGAVTPFDGSLSSFNGSDIYNGDAIIIEEVKSVAIASNHQFSDLKKEGFSFKEVYSASTGAYGIYTVKNTSDGVRLRIYNPSNKGERGFYIKYKLTNLAVLHNDIAEIGFNLFTQEQKEEIRSLEMHIHIPRNNQELRAWGHGPLWGETKNISKEEILLTIEELKAETSVDIRFVFDKAVVFNSQKTSGVEGLASILTLESKKAEEANEVREEARKQIQKKENIRIILIVMNAGWLVGLFILILYVYQKYDREYDNTLPSKYYREFPDPFGPEIVGYLLHKQISNQDLSASILNLIYKKAIGYEEINKKDYKFIHLHQSNITETEEKLLDWMFGETEEITLKTLQKEAKISYDDFLTKYNRWKVAAEKEGKRYHFFEDSTKNKVLSSMYSLLGLFLGIICIGYSVFGIISVFASVISFVYFMVYQKRTKTGNESYRKWIGLKNYMIDFGNMKEKELPEISLWEKYLVYAVSLGCAKKLAKTMEIKMRALEENGVDVSYLDFHRMRLWIAINQNLSGIITSAVQTANQVKIANSSNSSSGGFGGGFSGGGGSFGGGGGGGRF